VRTPKARHALLLLGIGLVAALALAGLGLAGSSSGNASSDQLIVLEDDIAPALDLDGATAGHPGLQEVLINTMEPLLAYPRRKQGPILVPNFKVDPFGFEPRLATSWTKKGLVWTFKLRRGVKSCAGNTFTADDVIYTMERAISVSGAAPIGWFLMNVSGIFPLDPVQPNAKPEAKKLHGEVTKIDEYTVRFKQLHPNELWPRMLEIFGLWMFDSKEMRKHATAADPWSHKYTNTTNSPGFGAYCLTKWSKGTEMNLSANPNYYRGQPRFKRIVIRKVPSDANRVASIQSGAADIVTNLTPQEYANLAKNSRVTVLAWSGNRVLRLGINSNFAPWNLANNALIRQAVAYAVPYDAILKADYLGTGRRWYGSCESSYYGFKPIRRYSTDLAKAKALLARAGFPEGKGLEKHGQGFSIVYVAERRSLIEPIANRIKTGLAQIGITAQLNPVSQAEYLDRTLTKYDTPMFISDQDRPLGPDVGYCSLLFYVSKKNGGLNNSSAWVNPRFDNLYKLSSTTVGQKRLDVLHQMQDILMRDLPIIPVAEVPSQLAVRKGITNWAGTTYDILSYWEFKSS
jgi:peptide/nickel transport system substrate-binding protein